jgi:plasmid stabilization system protein ParE
MALELVFLPSARLDLQWFRIYYTVHFPEGMAKANNRFDACLKLLCDHPMMGRAAGRLPRRRFSVPDTPYTIVYQQQRNSLEIVRVLDQRKETCLKELFDL